MIEFTCQRCHMRLKAPDQAAGRWKDCPKCGLHLKVPGPVEVNFMQPPPVRRAVPPVAALPDDVPPQPSYEPPPSSNEEPAPRDEPPDRDEPDVRRRRSTPLTMGGILLACLGGLLVTYYALVYDTTVPLYPDAPHMPDRVYNIGLMHNRTVGVGVGFGFLATGIALAAVGRR